MGLQGRAGPGPGAKCQPRIELGADSERFRDEVADPAAGEEGAAEVERVDAVLWTHYHADQVHGIDDLRPYALRQGEIEAWLDQPTFDVLDRRLATGGGAGLAALFALMDLYGTWVAMPRVYADTADQALQWQRLTMIHPAILSGHLRWAYLGLHVLVLGLVLGALVYVRREAAASPSIEPSIEGAR